MVTGVPAPMPRSVKFALGAVWFQAVINVLAGIWILSEVNNRLEHGQEVENLGLVRFSVYLAFGVGAALVLSGVFAGQRFSWVRSTILVVEAVALLVSLINILFSGVLTAVVGFVLAISIARVMLGEDGREWFQR